MSATLTLSETAGPAACPIRFRDQLHSARKTFWEGTQRVRPPAETLAAVRPYFGRMGLTRLADVTGLDRIGIPTVLSVRPNSPSLSVDAGKGFTTEAAMASAAMECVERYSAETTMLPEIVASYNQVALTHSVVPHEQIPVRTHQFFSRDMPVRWNLGWDLLGQREVAAPTLLVGMHTHRLQRGEFSPFQSGSNGLSSGNNFLEAVNGGLLELVERDAVSCWRVASSTLNIPIPRVRPETIEHTAVRALLDRFERAGLGIVLYDCTVDTGIPVYMAYLYDLQNRHIGIYRGYGAHLDPGIAMIRALTEAVQGRLIFISGSRDDYFRHHYMLLKQGDDSDTIQRLDSVPAVVDARLRASLATDSFEGDVGVILDRLRAVGIAQALVFDLTPEGFDVSALRVMVPGLEGYMFDYYSPGPRAQAFIEELRK